MITTGLLTQCSLNKNIRNKHAVLALITGISTKHGCKSRDQKKYDGAKHLRQRYFFEVFFLKKIPSRAIQSFYIWDRQNIEQEIETI